MLPEIFQHTLLLTSRLDRNAIFYHLAMSSLQLTGASHAAIETLDDNGNRESLLWFPSESKENAELPKCLTTLDLQIADCVFSNEMYPAPADSAECPVASYLACGIGAASHIFARFYLVNKATGFTAEDAEQINYLAQAAAVAISNADLYSESQSNAHWLHATQKILASFLHGDDEENSLRLIAYEMRRAARANAAVIVLPSLDDQWRSEIVDGAAERELLGIAFNTNSAPQVVTRTGTGRIIEDISMFPLLRITQLSQFGPALIVPLISHDQVHGSIILLRNKNTPTFRLYDLNAAENAALQAAIAMELTTARQLVETAAELDERARISRDLHDLSLQQLFASGMSITALKGELVDPDPQVIEVLDSAIDHLDSSAQQIRQIVHALRGEKTEGILVDRLSREIAMALQLLGFAPSLVITWKGKAVRPENVGELDTAIGSSISDDIIAVVRESLSNITRHARASSCSVNFTADEEQVLLEISDDGVGLPRAPQRRSGLANLAARAQRHGGNFSISSRASGTGTCVQWQVPLR